MPQNKVIHINKFVDQTNLRLIAAQIDSALSLIDDGWDDIGIDAIRRIRSLLPDPKQRDSERCRKERESYLNNLFESDEW
jgi:hypothetical protein